MKRMRYDYTIFFFKSCFRTRATCNCRAETGCLKFVDSELDFEYGKGFCTSYLYSKPDGSFFFSALAEFFSYTCYGDNNLPCPDKHCINMVDS